MLNQLVFIESENMNEEPFTTDELIADVIGIKRESVQRLIRTHQKRLLVFGDIKYKLRKATKGSKGGTHKKIYLLNYQQAIQVIDWTRNLNRNCQKASKLKDELIEIKTTGRDSLQLPVKEGV